MKDPGDLFSPSCSLVKRFNCILLLTNHFGAGRVFELDLGDSEIPLTPKLEREQKLLEEQLKKKEK